MPKSDQSILPYTVWSQKLRQIARLLADSLIFVPARKKLEQNRQNWNLPLSKSEKLLIGVYLILKDFSKGSFPPTFDDQAKAYTAEAAYFSTISSGVGKETMLVQAWRKPFGSVVTFNKATKDYATILSILQRLSIPHNAKFLELGCGTGWMCEFLARSGYFAVGTSIGPDEISIAQKRAESLRVAGSPIIPRFRVAAMESVDEALADEMPFDIVFVYEALHHAFSWQKTIHASYRSLKRGGYLLICNEPNVLHTFISYRVAKLSNTHEIGMSRRAIIQECLTAGFSSVNVLRNRFDTLLCSHWIAAQK